MFNENQECVFAGRKMTLGEFCEQYGLDNDDKQSAAIVINGFIKKGKLRLIESQEQQAYASVAKDLALDEKLELLAQEETEENQSRHDQKRAGRLTYGEVEFDVAGRASVEELHQFVTQKLYLKADVVKDGAGYVLTVYGATDADLNAINRRRQIDKASKAIYRGTTKAADSVVGAIDFTAQKVAVPVAKAGVKTTFGLLKAVAKTVGAVGSTVISSGASAIRQTASELSNDTDVLRARRELIDVKDSAVRKFNSQNSFGNGVRIKA